MARISTPDKDLVPLRMVAVGEPVEEQPAMSLNQPESGSTCGTPRFSCKSDASTRIRGEESSRSAQEPSTCATLSKSPFTPSPRHASMLCARSRSGMCLPPTDARWQWFHDRTDTFRDYKPVQNLKIEYAFQRGDSKVRLQSGKDHSTPMEIFFVDMIQYDPITSNTRVVRRLGSNSTWMRLRRWCMTAYRSWHKGHSAWPVQETFEEYQLRRKMITEGKAEVVLEVKIDEGDRPQEVFQSEMARRRLSVADFEPGEPELRSNNGQLLEPWGAAAAGQYPLEGKLVLRRKKLQARDGEEAYDVTMLYHDPNDPDFEPPGWIGRVCASIARTHTFVVMSMFFVFLNSLWIAYETDENRAARFWEADLGFILVENFFCVAFTVELTIRFLAFRQKSDAFLDTWFRFDFVLVGMMLTESYLMPLAVFLADSGFRSEDGEKKNIGDFSVLRIARLLRLTRMTRLLRAVPEVMTLLKGIIAAFRSVVFTLLLLLILLYVFGIIFRSQAKDHSEYLEDKYFATVWESMWVLLVHGTFLDAVSDVLGDIRHEGGWTYTSLFVLFILLSSFTVLNMLIGILCEVITKIKEQEDASAETLYLKNSLLDILECYDRDGDRSVGKQEFRLLMENPEVIEALNRYGTDVEGLKTLSEVIYRERHDEKGGDPTLTFMEFIDKVMQLKGDHAAKVTDIVELREYLKQKMTKLTGELRNGQAQILSQVVPAIQNVEAKVDALARSQASLQRVVIVDLIFEDKALLHFKHAAAKTIGELVREHGHEWATDSSRVALGPELTLGAVVGSSDTVLTLHIGSGSMRCNRESFLA